MKISLNLNALYTKISFDLSKVFKECSLTEYMKQSKTNNMILQGIYSLDYLNYHISYGFKKMEKSD